MTNHHCYRFFDVLSVEVVANPRSMAAKRFHTRYRHYACDRLHGTPDVTIRLLPFQFGCEKTYLFNHFRVSDRRVSLINRYKTSRWKSEVSPYGQFPCTVQLEGNLSAQISMVDLTLGYLLIWFLSLKGQLPLHAGAVAREGEGTIFAGRRGVGKTTLVGKLLDRGYQMVSEDRILLQAGRIHGLRLPVNIKYDRNDPGIAKLPAAARLRVRRNRLLSILSMNYFTLLEPVPLETLLPGKLVDSAKAGNFIYLQSGGAFKIEETPSREAIADQVVRGNMFDFPHLRQEQTAYNFAFPRQADERYWTESRAKLLEELASVKVRRVTIPVHPSDAEWGRLLDLIEQ